jgi:hypothetical protein
LEINVDRNKKITKKSYSQCFAGADFAGNREDKTVARQDVDQLIA